MPETTFVTSLCGVDFRAALCHAKIRMRRRPSLAAVRDRRRRFFRSEAHPLEYEKSRPT
jgi:hypothetical protein